LADSCWPNVLQAEREQKGVQAMFLRATRVQTPPDKIEQSIENFKTNTVKSLRAAPGNQGAVLLVNRQTGAALGITYWESAKALAANEQVGIQARTQTTKSVPGTQIVNVERGELMIMERTEAPKAGTFVRLVTVNGDPDKVDAGISSIRNHVLPVLKALKGYRATIASVDRQTGRLAASTVWETKEDLDASESKLAGPRAEAAKAAGAGPNDVQVEIFESAFVEISAAVTQAPARA
jgi:heme-degrading monooxygenase HmoA